MGGDKVPSQYDSYVEWFEEWKKRFLKKHKPKKNVPSLPEELRS